MTKPHLHSVERRRFYRFGRTQVKTPEPRGTVGEFRKGVFNRELTTTLLIHAYVCTKV